MWVDQRGARHLCLGCLNITPGRHTCGICLDLVPTLVAATDGGGDAPARADAEPPEDGEPDLSGNDEDADLHEAGEDTHDDDPFGHGFGFS